MGTFCRKPTATTCQKLQHLSTFKQSQQACCGLYLATWALAKMAAQSLLVLEAKNYLKIVLDVGIEKAQKQWATFRTMFSAGKGNIDLFIHSKYSPLFLYFVYPYIKKNFFASF